MRRRILLLWSVFLFLAVPLGAETVGRIVAVVNNEVITLQELKEALAQTPPPASEADVSDEAYRQEILSRLIDQRLILQKAGEAGVTVSEEELEEAIQKIRAEFPSQEEFEQQLARQGLSPDRFRHHYRNQMVIKRMVDREIRFRIGLLSPKELAEYYNRHREEFKQPERLRLLAILIRRRENPKEDRKAKNLVQDLLRRLKKGESFEALAGQFSEGPGKEEGGNLGWVEPEKLLKEIAVVVNSLKPGEMTPVLETALGYHLFRLEEREEARTLPFRKVKPVIENRLWEEKMHTRYERWLETLKKESYIEIY